MKNLPIVMKYKFFFLLIGFLWVGCSKKQKISNSTPIKIVHKFNDEEVKWFKNKGNGSIKGIAKFKSKNGTIRFGKDFRIELMPNSLYTEERLTKIYNHKDSGYVHVEDGIPKFTPDPKGYHDTKKTMCNEKGEFEFNNLPPGNYYIIAFMFWDKTGGGIMQQITLSEDENDSKPIEMVNF